MQAKILSVLEGHIIFLSIFSQEFKRESVLTLLRLVLNVEDKFQIHSISCFQ